MKSRTVRLADLQARIIEPDGDPTGIVCFAHGYGAPGTDLVPLAAELVALQPALAQARFIFPEAPLVPSDMGPWGGRAWWPIDMVALDRALRSGTPRVLAEGEPDGMAAARKKLHQALDLALREAHLGWDRLVLGGFSQGAMLAIDLALRLEEAPAAVVAFSPTLVNEAAWRTLAAKRRGLTAFISHGRQDPLLPFAATESLVELLVAAGLTVDFLPFHGPHTIAAEGLERAAQHLARLLAPA